MPQTFETSLKRSSLTIAAIIGIFGAIQAYAILPYRVEQIEKKQASDELSMKSDHDLLIQISRDTQYIKERLDRGYNKQP